VARQPSPSTARLKANTQAPTPQPRATRTKTHNTAPSLPPRRSTANIRRTIHHPRTRLAIKANMRMPARINTLLRLNPTRRRRSGYLASKPTSCTPPPRPSIKVHTLAAATQVSSHMANPACLAMGNSRRPRHSSRAVMGSLVGIKTIRRRRRPGGGLKGKIQAMRAMHGGGGCVGEVAAAVLVWGLGYVAFIGLGSGEGGGVMLGDQGWN
jgi:hypothetical protein